MPDNPHPIALAGEMSKIDKLKQMLGEDVDAQLMMDVIEGETNALEMLDVIVHTILADEAMRDDAEQHAKRWKERADKRRAIVLQIMERIGTRSARRSLYTLSVTDGPKAVHITDEAQIPLGYQRISPDKAAIARALKEGEQVPGAQLNNGPPVLRIIR